MLNSTNDTLGVKSNQSISKSHRKRLPKNPKLPFESISLKYILINYFHNNQGSFFLYEIQFHWHWLLYVHSINTYILWDICKVNATKFVVGD